MFNLKCLDLNVKPKGIRIKHHCFTTKVCDIIERAERQLLNARIGQNIKKITKIQETITNISGQLSETLPVDIYHEASQLCDTRAEKEFDKCKTRQIKKLENLVHHRDQKHKNKRDKELETLTENYKKKWVVNLADKDLTPSEKSLLQKGPKFAITPFKIPAKSYITCAESKLKELPPGCEVDKARHEKNA